MLHDPELHSGPHMPCLARLRVFHRLRAATATAAVVMMGTLVLTCAPARGAAQTVAQQISSLRLINYYPALNGWTNMWSHWNPAQMAKDFRLLQSLHANAVRIIIPSATFGYPSPAPTMMARLSQTITLAGQSGLKTELTLFDGFSGFADVTGSKSWAASVLAPFTGDAEIAYIDLHNELAANADPAALAWAQALVPYVQHIDGGIPVTVSTSISASLAPLQALAAGLAKTPPDLFDVHYYGKIDHAYSVLAQAKRIGGSVPLFVGETGFATDATYPWAAFVGQDMGSLEQYQAYYLRTVEAATSALGLPPAAPWILFDFNPGAINAGSHVPSYEYRFGLVRTDGTLKPAAAAVSAFFAGAAPDTTINNSFESLNAAGTLPTLWKPWLPNQAVFLIDHLAFHTGGTSARIDRAVRSSGGCPGFYVYPITRVLPGATYMASSWARGAAASGTSEVVLAWFDAADKYIGGSHSTSLPGGTTTWRQLSLIATAPPNAAAVELHLEVCDNPGTTWWDDVSFTGPPFAVKATPPVAAAAAATGPSVHPHRRPRRRWRRGRLRPKSRRHLVSVACSNLGRLALSSGAHGGDVGRRAPLGDSAVHFLISDEICASGTS